MTRLTYRFRRIRYNSIDSQWEARNGDVLIVYKKYRWGKSQLINIIDILAGAWEIKTNDIDTISDNKWNINVDKLKSVLKNINSQIDKIVKFIH